jgi:4-amino-4-deoxy-L-arabinose transferase-like glycosyltransferase
MKLPSRRYCAVILITLLAAGLRLFAARTLYGDTDEPIYMKRAVAYANFLRTGQYGMLASYDETYEHPALYKILYGVALLTRRPIDTFHSTQVPDGPVLTSDASTWIMADRYLSVLFGTLAVMALALVNPLAGLLLALHGLAVKYTSEVRLEALPLLTSIVCMATYLRWFDRIGDNAAKPSIRQTYLWLAASAFFLGLTAASKYVYCVVAVAIIVHFIVSWLWGRIPRHSLWSLAAWAVIALVVFFLFDPYLWPDPIARLTKSLQYNFDYSQSNDVTKWDLPWYQPLLWLLDPFRFSDPRPRSALLFDIDLPIFLLAAIGLPRLLKKRPFYFGWLVIAVAFLFLWNTKWPPYGLIAVVPMCVAATEGITVARDLGRKYLTQEAIPPSQNDGSP